MEQTGPNLKEAGALTQDMGLRAILSGSHLPVRRMSQEVLDLPVLLAETPVSESPGLYRELGRGPRPPVERCEIFLTRGLFGLMAYTIVRVFDPAALVQASLRKYLHTRDHSRAIRGNSIIKSFKSIEPRSATCVTSAGTAKTRPSPYPAKWP